MKEYKIIDSKRSIKVISNDKSILAQINKKSGKFMGNVDYLIVLGNKLKEYNKQEEESFTKLIDRVIERIKKDLYYQDETAIDELLRFIPKKYLLGYLSED